MKYLSVTDNDFIKIADAIREKTGKSGGLTLEQMPEEIAGIETGGGTSAPFCEVSVTEGLVTDALVEVMVKADADVNIQSRNQSTAAYYYNHEQFPEIPAELVESYPYILIMRHNDGTTRAYASTAKPYFDGVDRTTIPAGSYGRCTYDSTSNAWGLPDASGTSTYFAVHSGGNWAVWWSNYDVPNGSPDSEAVYFPASQPQAEQPADATHCYYNGLRLPVIPADALATYPYVWIRKNITSGYYEMYCSKVALFHSSDDSNIQHSGSVTKKRYRIAIANAETATGWEDNGTTTSNIGIDSDRTVFWSNYNIPDGSATATKIYFYGNMAVPVPN